MGSVKKAAHEIYRRIDNDLYNVYGDGWWQSDSPLYLMQSSINPARVGYFKKILFTDLNVNPQGKSALEVGCGGGILCEEIARMGFEVTGIDPSEHSLQIAANHAKADGLRVNYEKGTGEALPCQDNSTDIVFCCDVLEHVRDVPKVISEIFRVLKPGGCFCYDTLNRTFLSKLTAINVFSGLEAMGLCSAGSSCMEDVYQTGRIENAPKAKQSGMERTRGHAT